ncbi:hypothetical protein CATYP_03995 [Corynebacterium atypicum]|uniref:Bacterial Pleckstrin homology domain-containing protein n=1 Tax=Corynebacterium atypicum TaxID=191610 RepID=A0ABN4DCG8_9CORY|nr:hypothetical protein [Corynebacterium atypicum]AIG63950.1 hypothetical protein CATYP_03995 [Corynebacterium atypicum]
MLALGVAGLVVLIAVFAGGWTVRADSSGFYYQGILDWPKSTIALHDIDRAEVIDLKPGQWGGWGYKTPLGATGLITRGGPALRLTLKNGGVFAATCADPASGAQVINHYLGA